MFSLSMYHEMYFIAFNQGLYFTSFMKKLKHLHEYFGTDTYQDSRAKKALPLS